MIASEKTDPFDKIMDDVNITRRIAEWAADNSPKACELDPDDPRDPNLWCMFQVIAERIGSIELRLEDELAKGCRARRLNIVE